MARAIGERHHILHHGRVHEANKDNKFMRTRGMGLIALLDTDAHDELHRSCPGVPPPDIFMAMRIRRDYEGHHDPNVAVERYMKAVESAKRSPKNHPIERALADLVVMAVDLQRPFIREGLILPEVS